MDNDAFSIRIFAPAGHGRALRLVDKDNWSGHALMCRRAAFPGAQSRPEFSCPGVYILYGTDEERGDSTVYIGEGDPMLPRLQKHFKTKEFWTDAICFWGSENSLTKQHVQYLESRLIALAKQAKRCVLDNGNVPTLPTMPEADVAYVERFLEHVLDCLAVLRIMFFAIPENARPGSTLFRLSGKGARAQGYESDNGFIVSAGSSATKQLSNAFLARAGYVKRRESLIDEGVLIDDGDVMRFAQDFEFDSPSAAAVIVYGNPMNGRDVWQTPEGRTLKQIQEATVA